MLSNTKNLTLNQAVERITYCEETIEKINMFFKSLESECYDFKLDLVMMKGPIMNRDEEYELNSLLSKIIVFELDKIAGKLEEVLNTLTNSSEVVKYNFNYIDEDQTLETSIENHVKSLTEKELLEILSFSRHLSYISGFTSDFILKKSFNNVETTNKKGLLNTFRKMFKKEDSDTCYDISLTGCTRTEWEGYSVCEAIINAIDSYKEVIVKQIHAIGYKVE